MPYDDSHDHYDLESRIEKAQGGVWDAERAIRELALEVARLSMRVRELEQQIPDPLWAEKAEAEQLRQWDEERLEGAAEEVTPTETH